MGKAIGLAISITIVLLLSAFAIPVEKEEELVLRTEKLAFTPKEFYIADIIDERADKKAVAYLLPVGVVGSKSTPVDFAGGGLSAIQKFTRHSLAYNTALRPVVIRLKEFHVKEKAGAAGRVTGEVSVVMAFELQRDDEPVPLLQYKGGARYDRPAGKNEVTEPAIRKSLVEALRYFNTWMDREAATNEKLAQGIKVTFTDYIGSADQDTVFYTLRRPLNWRDFKAPPSKTSRFAATVFPSFAYAGESKVEDGIIHLNLTMKVYILKSSSWVKEDFKDAYGLNHEQRHFDIVKLVAERFKQKIKPEMLSVEDYNSIIQYQFIESYREMNRLQDQYDTETRHGLDKAAQERWNQQLDKELKSFDLK
ncbi:hypothetical protein H9Q13_04440 [Pontibacter sp. JH31]|uniref:DUF922 domain-containing protein n=1 Tax=Pontibacter aquaedesilientis TaxID=2766980 RepID=A0ABR7XFN0_9BACT|nr:hypothetical protein [Pontibacter aquaedesilientis]